MQPQSPPQDNAAHIPWHPAFVEALRLELEQYEDALEFIVEHPLTGEPLKIDVVVIKKAKGVIIDKNIAAIFRDVNIIEYKSPDDYVSVGDFYKVYGYACFYSSLENVPITGITITFVENRNPRELTAHLRETRGYEVAERRPGIYTVSGDILPIQVIDSRRLSADENVWLQGLSNKLEVADIERITAEIGRQGKAGRIEAYLYAIAHGNVETIQEAARMSKSAVTLERVFEEVGWIAKWEARGKAQGEERKAFEIAQNLARMGLPLDTVVSATHLDPEKLKPLYARNPA